LLQSAQTAWQHRILYVFLFPFACLTAVFGIWPILLSLVVAFTDSYTALSDHPVFVGWHNFRTIAADPLFLSSVAMTILFTVTSVILNVILALAIALFLNSRAFRHTSPALQAVMIIPVIAPDVATFIVWKWMFNQNFGAVNAVLSALGLASFPGITTATGAFMVIVIVEFWASIGFYALIFLANFRLLDPSLDEAARIDGASLPQRVCLVWIPQLRPAIAINTVYAVINFLKTFTVILVITGGGPNFHTNLLSYYAYTKFNAGEYGEATAMATALFALVLLFSYGAFRYNEARDHR
jgi:ABC-type sugar transport system permease subunit